MKKFLKFILLYPLVLLLSNCDQKKPSNEVSPTNFKRIPVTYPFSKKEEVSDEYFGKKVADPYRWLEDDQSPETKDWVQKQNIVTNGYLTQIPYRDKIAKRLGEIWNFEKFGTPFKKAGKYYFFKNDGLQNQSVLYMQENLQSQPLSVLDPNTFSKDGTSSLQEYGFSKDGRYLAYGISTGGSDWRTIKIKDMATSEILSDEVQWAKFTSIAWEGEGFYYTRYPEPQKGDALKGKIEGSSVYFHRIGTPQANDVLVHRDAKNPKHYFNLGTTDDERFAYLVASESTSGNSLAIKDLSKQEKQFTPIAAALDKDFNVLDNLGDSLLVLTNHGAPNSRIILVHASRPSEKDWETFVPESSTDVLTSAVLCGDKLLALYLHNASSSLRAYDLNGKLVQEIALPEIGTISVIQGERDEAQAFFSFQSFLRPNTIYALDTKTLRYTAFKTPKLNFDSDAYTTEQVWYTSKDGTKVPMFVSHKKGIVLDGNNPTLLYGYGGFNISVTPSFSASRAALLENNGVYVVANIRGGGEFGEKWHKAGTVLQKQNVFDDFIAAAEHLIAQKYTSKSRLAIEGGSNGGLLVGACMTQRPDLFAVCFPRVGVLDMLRYHKFTIGYAWAVDYGRSDADQQTFEYLHKYSPLHNAKRTQFPATMVTTADHDDRVVPAHSFKFAATLQEKQEGAKPVLIRIETSAGHGAGKPTSKLLEEAADMLSFMLYEMRVSI